MDLHRQQATHGLRQQVSGRLRRGTSNGTPAVIWDCNGQTNQQWNINANGTITGVQSGLCLDAGGANTANGTKIQLWSCSGGANQQWSLQS
ncbi:ricin-type beta-trefoil lectin domain protein [Streptomyces sp. NBC_01384]|uniref:ricin-type beta-trefoil lectin domain protein n=1 Tax=Streptomyces sp. NBC_01384 TaxID=2903847 RepID=UPI00386BD3A2